MDLYTGRVTKKRQLFKEISKMHIHDLVQLRSKMTSIRVLILSNCFACYCIMEKNTSIENGFKMVAQPGIKEKEPMFKHIVVYLGPTV